jgi:hypothetical protein
MTQRGHRFGIGASEFAYPHLLPADETHSIRTITSRNLICAGFRIGMNMTDVKQERLQSASNPRRTATFGDVARTSYLRWVVKVRNWHQPDQPGRSDDVRWSM